MYPLNLYICNMNVKSFVPNGLTLGNLLFGIIGIVNAFETNLVMAAYCMILAGVFDFFDGLAARALGVSGELGKQLDSLADMTTFGVLPSIMLYQYISIGFGEYFTPLADRPTSHLILEFSGFVFALFACLRLAKFNIDTNQSDTFIGVPTPVSALFVASFALVLGVQFPINMYFPLEGVQLNAIAESYYWTHFEITLVQWLFNPYFWIGMMVFLSGMMVSPFKMLNFKFKEMSWSGNKARYTFLLLSAFLMGITLLPYVMRISFLPYIDYLVFPIILLLYMIFSLFSIKKSTSH